MAAAPADEAFLDCKSRRVRQVATLSEHPPQPPPLRDVEAATLAHDGSPPDYSDHPSDVPCPLPRRFKRVRMSSRGAAFPSSSALQY